MEDDIIGALTQEVKEEVVENYLYQRRLIEEQIKHVNELAEQTAELEKTGCEYLARIYDALSEPEFIDEFIKTLGLKDPHYWEWVGRDSRNRSRIGTIKIRGLTERARFKKLILESYRRLFEWTSQYKEAYMDLEEACKAVNHNLKKFENDYDLLTLLRFLKDMDFEFVEKKYWLSDNFTPDEMASIESNLSFKPMRMERFKLNPPPNLPKPAAIQRELNTLADCVYGQCADRIKKLIQ